MKLRFVRDKPAAAPAAEERMLSVGGTPLVMIRETASGQRITPNSALFVSDVLAAVRLLSETVATLPLHVFRKTGEERRRLHDGALVELLDRPSPTQTASGLLGTIMLHLLCHGNAYVGLYRGPDGGIEQLVPLDPERVAVQLRGGRLSYRYSEPENGRLVELPDTALVHVRALSRDALVGMSVVELAREAIGVSSALAMFAARYFGADCRPSGLLKLGHGAGDRLQEIADAWNVRHSGAENSHRIAAVSGDVSFEPISSSAEDAQLAEARQWQTAEICRVFKIPASMLGAPSGDSMTYGNREADAAHFIAHSIRPWTVAIEEAFNAHEELCPAGVFAEFSFQELLRPDTTARYAAYETGLRAGFLTVDEVRARENLPPLVASERLPAGVVAPPAGAPLPEEAEEAANA